MTNNNSSFLRFLAAVLACLTIGIATADAQSMALPQKTSVTFSYISVNEGLSSNSVRALLQDKYGYVWVGTSRGVNRWDGYDVAFYRNTNGMSVTALCEKGDTIWIGTESGLYLYSQFTDSVCKFETKSSEIDFSRMIVSHISADFDGNVWVASMGGGIAKIDTKNNSVKHVSSEGNNTSYACLCVDNEGDVWATSNWAASTLIRYDKKQQRFVPAVLQFAEGQKMPYNSMAITQGADGYMWLGTANGSIVRFNPKTLKATVELSNVSSGINNVHSITEIKEGYFLIGSDSGLLLYSAADHSTRLHTTSSEWRNALSDKFVYPIMTDREGGTWVGTYYGGVNYYHPSSGDFMSHVSLAHSNSVSGNVINHFCEDKLGHVWIASDDGGLSVYYPNDDSYRNVTLSQNGTHNVHALCAVGDKMLVGTYAQGMSIVDINTLAVTHIPVLKEADDTPIDISSYDIYRDSHSRVWVGTFDAVCLMDVEKRTFRVMHHLNAPVLNMLQTADGTMWFATDMAGLWSYDSKTNQWKQYDGKALVPGNGDKQVAVNCLFEDTDGTLLCGTSVGMLKRNSKTDTFSEIELPHQVLTVLSIQSDGGYLWLATNAGLCRYNRKSGKVEQTFKGGSFLTTDFLPSATCKDSRGTIYLGTTHGYVTFSPEAMHHNSLMPKVRFTGLEVMNQKVKAGSEWLPLSLNHTEEIELSYRENVICLSFSALSFVQSTDNLYQYYLEGFDDGWIDAGAHHSVTYTNLSPGTYVFHVRASNNDGVYSPDTTLRIVITPPFYWNNTARIFYLILILLAIYYVIRRLMRRAEKRHQAEIEEINEQKEQQIKEIHTQKEQEIQEINTQKEQEIQEINEQKELEVHEARIKFMTITPRDQDFLDRLEEAVEKNFSNPDLSVDALAREVGVSRTGLFTKLKTLADVTPNEMIQVIRLKHAAQLLQENRYRVSEVCYMVGFSSPSYFSKCFQKQYGVTPAKFV